MQQTPHHPKVPGNAKEIRAIYSDALVRFKDADPGEAVGELNRINKNIRRQILTRKLSETKLRRVTVDDALIRISDESLEWALDQIRGSA